MSLAVLFQTFSDQSIAQVFFVTAAAFGTPSLYRYITNRCVSGLGALLIIGLVGVVIASLVNIFPQSGLLHFVASDLNPAWSLT